MNVIPVKWDEMKSTIIELGYVGENLSTQVCFECDSVFAEYPDAVPGLFITPPKGNDYPGVAIRDGNNVLWNVTSGDLANKGKGEVQLSFVVDSVVKKSATCRFSVEKSIMSGGEPPDPITDWLQRAEQALGEIPATIRNALETAKQSGAFKGDPGYSPTVQITDITNGHRVTITDEEGTHAYDVLDGGDGVSPSVSTSAISGGTAVTITDRSGNHTFNVYDGANGVSPDLTVTDITNGHRITIVDVSGTNTFDVMNGQQGSPGDPTQLIDDATASASKTFSSSKIGEMNTQLLNDIQGISTAQKDITGCMPVPMVANKYISLSGSTVSMSDGHPAYSSGETAYSCGYVACVEGDVFTVNGTGGVATRLWGFVDDEGNILSVSEESVTVSGLTLVAPSDSAWFITHTNDGSVSYKGNTLELIGELVIHPYESINNFGQGSMSGTDGHIIESTTRIYTNKFFPFEDGLFLTCDNNIKWSLRYYQSNLLFLYGDETWRTVGGVVKPLVPANDKYFRINVAYKNDATITPSDNISIKLWKSPYATDKTLSLEGKIADAKTVGDRMKELSSVPTPSSSMLGNATIRAAKTINFADGTPPVIDWYLVQSVDSKFYRTKDFVTKEYLFTTRYSGMAGYVSDWSCAILPNNDVLFVADAAGLSTSTYGRLKDENRINPIVFLASENYAQAHVIDFGSSLKPCGWLNNVGFCTLPNGDFVFAEYTRGTVKTANVWLVSGDVTDPSNWSVTWSVNIIDTMDSTTPGTKHCHEVMYDFFTGILYFGTGDSETGSNNYYSTDGGETWTLLYGEDKNRCRRLNFIFTEDYVYWASDSWQTEDHHFFIGERDNGGIVDVENATEVSLTSGNGQACYGIVYLKEQNLIVMMDRIDDPVTKKLNWYCYDLTTGTVEKIGEIGSADDTLTYLGFRCRFMDFYPTGNAILTGFSPRKTSANEDTNRNKLCGNQGGSSGDGSTRINNLLLYVYKNGTEYSYRATTLWI